MSSRGETSLNETKYVPAKLKWLMVVSGMLIFLGALNIYSSTYYMNIEAGVNPYSHFLKHALFGGVSLLAAVMLAYCPMAKIRRGAFIWCLAVLFLLILVLLIGRTVNGATRWISVGPFSLQPSEFAKVVGVIWTASHLADFLDRNVKISIIPKALKMPGLLLTGKIKELVRNLIYFTPLYPPLFFSLLVLKQPDMGTAGMILFFPLFLYVISGLPLKEVAFGMVLGFMLAMGLAIFEPYRMARIHVFLDPFSYAQSDGFQTVQSLIAVGSGGILGQGVGEGMSKFLYLPEQYTDFAFAVFAQEFGLVGASVLLFLYIAFLYLGLSVARKLKETYPALLVYGLTMMISVQGLINIAMVIGMFPVTGIPLPFISFGGSSLLTNFAALGLIWGTSVQSLRRVDLAERKRRIDAMEGRRVSLGQLSESVFYGERGRY